MKIKLYKIICLRAYMMAEQVNQYSLTPHDESQNNVDYQSYDDGGEYYNLPDGFEVNTGDGGSIYGHRPDFKKNGQYYWLSESDSGLPLLSGNGDKYELNQTKGSK